MHLLDIPITGIHVQGRLPIRAELQPLTALDFQRILRDTKYNLLIQQCQLLATEGVMLEFTDDAVDEIAEAAYQLNTGMHREYGIVSSEY